MVERDITGNRDTLQMLKQFTAARIALGRTGSAMPLKETLALRLAHAHARDAVYDRLDITRLTESLQSFGIPLYVLHSRAENRDEYLQRPDLGRRLDEAGARQLGSSGNKGGDIGIILGDGLSATAINTHAIPLLGLLLPAIQHQGLVPAPLTLVRQARVAIADEIGSLLQARLSLILIGERPGLSSPDSMGAYLTLNPAIGLTDESRNCVSNIQSEGLGYTAAAEKIMYLVRESLRLGISGVGLKENDSNLIC